MNRDELKKIAENLIDTFNIAGQESIDLYKKGLKIEIKEDKSPVSNGDLRVNDLITNKIKELTPNIPIISEETVDLKIKNTAKVFWLIDPIDGTKEYIAGRDEYTLNAALVINTVPVLGVVGVPKKNRLFYSYAPGESYLIESGETKKINCQKKQPKGKIVALSSALKPSDIILNKLKEFNVNLIVKMAVLINFVLLQLENMIFMLLEKELMNGIMQQVMLLHKMLEQLLKHLMKNLFYMEKKITETLVYLLNVLKI